MTPTSERLKEAMDLRGLKQIELVEKTGIDKGALSSYLSGRYKPKQTNLLLLSKALDVDITWLMGYDVPMEGDRKAAADAHLINRLRKDDDAMEVIRKYYSLEVDRQKLFRDMLEAMTDRD